MPARRTPWVLPRWRTCSRRWTKLKQKRAPLSFFVPVVAQSRILDPSVAQQVGFLDQVVEPDRVVDVALRETEQLAELPAKAYAYKKLSVRGAAIEAMHRNLPIPG